MKLNFILVLLLFLINFTTAITGETLKEEIELTINIEELFNFTLLSPEEGTYITNEIPFEYEASNIEEIILQIDNQNNISIQEKTILLLPNKNYHLKIYLKQNNKTKIIEKNITVDTEKFKIIYNKYKNFEKTTKFEKKPFEYYENFLGITLETNSGKIYFENPISLNDFPENKNKILNLDENSYIKEKEIYIDEQKLPNFNKKAKISFYNITYKNPKILKNEELCTDCKLISYENNTITYEVQGFSKYKIIEETTPSKTNRESSTTNTYSNPFEINTTEIQVKIRPEQYKDFEIKIKNNLEKKIEIKTEILNINNLVEINKEIILEAGEEKIEKIRIIAPLQENATTRIGEIKFISDNTIKELLILVDIQSIASLFDVQLKILNEDKIYKGTTITSVSEIMNLGNTEKVDACLKYEIKDINEKTILSKEKTLAVYTRIETITEIPIPENIKKGTYFLTLTITYDNQIATASRTFVIKSKNEKYYLLIIIPIILIIFLYLKNQKSKKSKSRGKKTLAKTRRASFSKTLKSSKYLELT